MIPADYFKRVAVRGRSEYAYYFDNMLQYNKFISEVEPLCTTGVAATLTRNLNNPAFVAREARKGSRWYGTTDTSFVRNQEDLNNYLFNNQLQNILSTLNERIGSIKIIDLQQSKQIKFTEKEIGVFSFDLASLGLVGVYDFYSPLLDKIVSPNLVKSEKDPDGKLRFFHQYAKEIPEHIVNFNTSYNGYYSDVLKRKVELNELNEFIGQNGFVFFKYPFRPEIQKHEVERRHRLNDKGAKMYSTTFKKSFIHIPKVEKELPRIDIIVNCSFSYRINAETQTPYSSIAAMALAQQLNNLGIRYRIIANYSCRTSNDARKRVFSFINIKSEGEPLDMNQMSVVLSDGRYLRYQQFRGYVTTQYDCGFGDEIRGNIGYPITDRTQIKEAYLKYLQNNGDLEDLKAAERPDSKIVVSGSLSLQQAEDEYRQIIDQIRAL